MALSRDIYKEFENVVGEENICDDPIIMPAYHSTEFATVILPKDTEEVQSVIKLCNKYKIKFKAVSTGWTGFFPPGIIYLDLRRMNRIIEINVKNMYAVVEPYVISAQLQAELMKRGLNCIIKGAGANCTALPLGHGHMDQTTSIGVRSTLATEWVTPEGEVVKLGSLGSSDEWFCGDGPGPSLEGVYRCGGVITKAAAKVYHWPGPSTFPLEGLSPNYTLSEMPQGLMVQYFSFPSTEKQLEAERKIGESEISFELMGFNIAMVASNISTSNEEDFENYERLRKLVQGPGFMVIIAGDSRGDFEYKKRVLQQIIGETGGKSLEPIEDPIVPLLFSCIRITNSIRETFRAGGLFSSVVDQGQRDLHVKWLEGAAKAKAKLISEGLVVDDGAYIFGWGMEHGHLGHTEIFCRHTSNPEAVKAVREWQYNQSVRALKGCFAVQTRFLPVDTVGPRVSNYHLWLGKLKQAFDPNGVAEGEMQGI